MTETASISPVSYSEPLTEWPDKRYLGLTAVVWMRIALVAVLMSALFWPNLRRLWLKTNIFSGESNWLHSPFVPALGLYYLYLNRDSLFNAHRQKEWGLRGKALAVWAQVQAMLLGSLFFFFVYAPSLFSSRFVFLGVPLAVGAVVLWLAVWCTVPGSVRSRRQAGLILALRDRFSYLADRSSQWFGLYALLWGLLFYAWGIWPGQNDFFKDVAMVAVLFGVTLMLAGWRIMKTAWFPILFLICAIPWPGLMYAKIALPLQELAAYVACAVLKITGVDAAKDGTKIIINVAGSTGRALNVAEACAGLKSLMTFITVAAAVGFLSHRALWQKLLIVVSAVPIAILCNVFRVAGQGLLDTYATQKLSDGFAHQFVGMVMLIPAFFMILFVGWLLDNLFIDEVDRRTILRGSRTPSPARQSLVIEIPRGAAKAAEREAGSTASPVPADLVAATQRLSNTQGIRRSSRSSPPQTVRSGTGPRSVAAMAQRKDNP
ncbi:MAG: exosortase/archaeosortase family protein [Tepidisphaeraceae bacterium]